MYRKWVEKIQNNYQTQGAPKTDKKEQEAVKDRFVLNKIIP